MYVAAKPLSESLPDGMVVMHPAGAVLERFESWGYAVQKAMLRMGVVQKQADARDGSEPVRAKPASDPQVIGEQALACPHCPGKPFANLQGLRLHTTRMHAGAAGE